MPMAATLGSTHSSTTSTSNRSSSSQLLSFHSLTESVSLFCRNPISPPPPSWFPYCRNFLHCIPFVLTAQIASTADDPVIPPTSVKNQPRPNRCSSGSKAATLPAESAQRVILPDAAAVLGLVGNMSTRRVLNV
jgi:hypothetical protein